MLSDSYGNMQDVKSDPPKTPKKMLQIIGIHKTNVLSSK